MSIVARFRDRAAPFRDVLAFSFSHWRRQRTRVALITVGVLLMTLADVLLPLYVGRLIDALTPAIQMSEAADRAGARALMVIMQADPGFDLPETPNVNERTAPAVDGYTDLLHALVDETKAFAGQVVLVGREVASVARAIAVVSHSLPRAAAQRLSFLSYTGDVTRARQHLVDDLLGALALDPLAALGAMAKTQGIRPIIGSELTMEDGTVLPVLVESRIGYQNLCRLIPHAQLRSEKGRSAIRWDELPEFAQGLIALTGDNEGPLVTAVAADVRRLTRSDQSLLTSAATIKSLKFPPDALLELIGLVENKTISSSAAQQVFAEMFDTGKSPAAIVQEKGLAQVSDTGAIEKFCDEVIAANPGPANDFKSGKAAALNFLKGQVMKLSKGKANPALVGEILEGKLKG